MTTEDRVKKLIQEHLGSDPEKITTEARFVEELGADSLDMVELTMAFEEEFGIEIPDDDAEKVGTVQDAISQIDAKLAEKNG